MKITIAQGAFLPVPPLRGGAVEKVWFALGKEFARRGHSVTHVSREFPGLPRESAIEEVHHIRVRGFDAPRSLMILKLLDLLYSWRVSRSLAPADILVTNTFWLPVLIRSERYGKLYVHVQRYPKGQMRFYRHAARIQSVSKHIQRAILKEVPGLEGKSIVIPNPIWGQIDPEAKTEVKSLRERQILYVGRVHEEKGLDLLVRAIGLIPQDAFAQWRLVVVGPSAFDSGGGGEHYLSHLRRLAQPIQTRVEWVGPVFESERLSAYYQQSSLFVYPSLAEKGEASPLAPLEAMSHGCPALVSDLECFRDYLSDGVTGFVFNHRAPNPESVLAAAIRRLIDNSSLLVEMGENARRKAANFSIERVAEQYLQDFETLNSDTTQPPKHVTNPCPPS